jgi:Peptidyl-prolyl cis-trans isomerase (rotamase) - cyclophilin family
MRKSLLLAAGILWAATLAGAGEHPKVLISTSLGDLTVELYPDKAPITVKNFLAYVDEGFYDGTIFHRVIPGFVIQGGGFLPGMKRKPTTRPPIKNEAANGLKNETGTIAMARTSDINSATSQFFINLKNNSFLDHRGDEPAKFGYAVFGKVTAGMDVVKKIASVKTAAIGRYRDVPVEPVVIKSIKRLK